MLHGEKPSGGNDLSYFEVLDKSCVRPTVEYAIPVWSFRVNQDKLSALDILQAKVCRRLLSIDVLQSEVDYHESRENLNNGNSHERNKCS